MRWRVAEFRGPERRPLPWWPPARYGAGGVSGGVVTTGGLRGTVRGDRTSGICTIPPSPATTPPPPPPGGGPPARRRGSAIAGRYRGRPRHAPRDPAEPRRLVKVSLPEDRRPGDAAVVLH